MKQFSQNGRFHWQDGVAIGIAVLYLILGIATLPRYGLTWDEGLGNLFFGERYLFYLSSFQEKYLDFKADLPELSGLGLSLFQSPFREVPHEFPALMDILSAASMHGLGYRLGWLDPVDAFHLPKVALTALFLWLVFRFVRETLGKTRALSAVVFLALFPRLWGDMHFNPKDVPEMVMFGLAVLSFYRWATSPTWLRAALTGLCSGAALAIKANALFLPVVCFVAWAPWTLEKEAWIKWIRSVIRLIPHLLMICALTLLICYLSWPYLYADPRRILAYFQYIVSQGGRSGGNGLQWQPLVMVLATLPEMLLVFLVVGILPTVRKAFQPANMLHRLMLAWLIVPISRMMTPMSVNFDGIRHYLEFLPAAMILASMGIFNIVEWFAAKRLLLKNYLFAGLMGVTILIGLFELALWHPFEYIYFNRLVGGAEGAQTIFNKDEVTDYWASSFRHGMEWVNQNAETGAALYVPAVEWLVKIPQKIWLRGDIEVYTRAQSYQAVKSGKPLYTMFITKESTYDEIIETCLKERRVVYRMEISGVVLMGICSK